MNPSCKNCGAKLLRWAWWEQPNEKILYFYCLSCDLEGRAPYIQVFENPNHINLVGGYVSPSRDGVAELLMPQPLVDLKGERA